MKTNKQQEIKASIRKIRLWLFEIKEFNAHDSSWIEETIKKLNKILKDLKE